MAEEGEVQVDEAEAEARDTGWLPEEEFKGRPGTWKPASEWVDYAHSMLPILNATNRRLKEQVAQQTREMASLKGVIATAQTSMQDLNKFHEAQLKEQEKALRKELAAGLKQAREDGDTEAEVEIQTQIAELGKARPAEAAKPPAPLAPVIDANLQEWAARNPWMDTDVRKSRRAVLVAAEIADDMPELKGSAAFYKELDKRLVAEFGPSGRPAAAKVAGGSSEGGGNVAGGGGGRGWSALPAEAKEAAKAFQRELVGENKRHKTLKDYQDSYAAEFYRQEDKYK